MKRSATPERYFPEYYVARAEQGENLASKAVLPPSRQIFLRLAAQWRALSAQHGPEVAPVGA
jgi:hypothetical protein